MPQGPPTSHGPPPASPHAPTHGSPLSARLRAGTRELHAEAERTGIMGRLLRGSVDRGEYAALLRSLLEIYEGLEEGIDRNRDHPEVAPIRWPPLYRAAALRRDLGVLLGPGGAGRVSPAVEAERYREHLEALSGGAHPGLLAAHAYARYLGDLHGGRVLGRRVAALAGGATAFHRFPDEVEADPAGWREAIRRGLDALPLPGTLPDAVEEEARDAFRRHIRLFRELDAAGEPAARQAPASPAPGSPSETA